MTDDYVQLGGSPQNYPQQGGYYQPQFQPRQLPVALSPEVQSKTSLWDRLFKKKELKKPNKVAVIFLKNNGVAQTMELESKKGQFFIGGKVYHEDKDCVYTVATKEKERLPLAIIPEWSLVPYGTKKWHDKPMLEKFHDCEHHVINGIRHAELVRMGGERDKIQWDAKKVIGLIIMVIIGGAILMNYM